MSDRELFDIDGDIAPSTHMVRAIQDTLDEEALVFAESVLSGEDADRTERG